MRTTWRRGPAGESAGPFLISYTEFAPHTMRDLRRIYLAAGTLQDACTELAGAVGVVLYWQPFRGRVGSLSAWEDERALRAFVALPYHIEIMRQYRDRGTLRAISWWADSFAMHAALDRGQRTLDGDDRADGR